MAIGFAKKLSLILLGTFQIIPLKGLAAPELCSQIFSNSSGFVQPQVLSSKKLSKKVNAALKLLNTDSYRLAFELDERVHRFYSETAMLDPNATDAVRQWVDRAALKKGLLGLVKDKPIDSTKIENIKFLSAKIISSKWLRLLIDPTQGYHLEDAGIPQDLMTKLTLEGIEKHRDELSHYYQLHQTPIEKRRLFLNRAANTAKILILIMMVMNIEEDRKSLEDKINQSQVESLNDNLDQIEANLMALDQALEKNGMYK